jgi:hypothetical protein
MADDYSPDRYTAGALRAGASLTGELETGGDVDWIKVRLQAGKTYRIDLEGVPTRAGTLDDPKLLGVHDYRTRLLPDTGDDDGGIGYNSRLFFSADRYGDYFIAVGARGHRTGTYKLLVEEVSTDDYPDGRFGDLGIEAPARGEIELPGDRDRFEVRLEAGRTYRIDIDGSPVAARQMAGRLYALRDAEDNLVTAITRDGDTRLYVRPSAEGIYTIEAGSASDSVRNTGRYSLSVEDVTRVDDHTSAGDSVVAVGGSLSGEVEKPGDSDWFALTLDAGALYQVEVQGRDSGRGTLADPLLFGIYADNGAGGPGRRVADSGDNDSGAGADSLVLFRAPEAGVWYLGAGSNFTSGTGTYTVSVREIEDQRADTGTAGAVQVGGNVIGALDRGADEDWFGVDLERDIEYRIEVMGNTRHDYGGSLYNPALTVYDAAGEVLYTAAAGDGSGKLGHNADLEFTASASGGYFIGIDGGGRTGSYTLYVNRLTDEYGTSILTGGRVVVGASSAGDIGQPHDRDWLAVDLVGGRAYRIELEGSPTDRGTLADPYLRGIYFDRELLPGTSDDDSGEGLNSRVEFLAPESSTYYIAAGAYSFRTGSYQVSVEEVADDHPAAPDTAALVAVDGWSTGAVDYGGDVDWFAVPLVAGRHYRINLEGTSTGQGALDDPRLNGLFDAAGDPVEGAGSDDDGGEGYNSRLDFSAPGTATYYIAAGAHAAHTGSYRLSVEEVTDDYPATTATGAVVKVGGSATGEIEAPGDTDWFAVELIKGREYLIDLEGWRTDGGTLDDPFLLGIHAADGTLINGTTNDDGGDGLNSRVSFEAPETGAYYIAAGAYEDYTGSYTLEVMDVF